MEGETASVGVAHVVGRISIGSAQDNGRRPRQQGEGDVHVRIWDNNPLGVKQPHANQGGILAVGSYYTGVPS